MELTMYDVIVGPVTSPKSYKLNKVNQQLMIRVHVHANKVLIKQAVERLFNVKVESVRTMIRKHTKVRVANLRHNARPSLSRVKIAYISLVPGHKLNFFDQAVLDEVASQRV